MKSKSQLRISRITIGRLFNLGNYEHVRYELTVEIPEGSSPRQALTRIMAILKAANPNMPVRQSEVDHARSFLQDPQAWHKNLPKEQRQKQIDDDIKEHSKTIATYEAWLKRRERALAALDRLGAVSVFKDAKETWEENEW